MWPLFLALTLLGPERQTAPHAYDPPSLQLAAPAVALAQDAQGVAMAWSMPNAAGQARIHVARLDRLGHLAVVRELAVVLGGDRTAALYPSMSRRVGAEGFLLTWVENIGSRTRAAYALLDASLAQAAPALLPGVGITTPPLAASGNGVMWVTSAAQFWHIETDGFARGPFAAVWPASDMTATAGGPRIVSGWRDPNAWICSGNSGCSAGGPPLGGYCNDQCRIYTNALRLVVPYDVVESSRLDFATDAQPAVESDGERVVVAWFRGAQKSGGDVVAALLEPLTPVAFRSAVQAPLVLGRFGPDSGRTRPDIAVTARGTFVVWRTTSAAGDHDVVGALLARAGTVEQFTVASSPADERDPSILELENGLLLVAYRKIEGNQSRIAWRFLGEQGKRRSVR
ncbi:MAG TPA: hypothetical protein VGF28_08395 [Thermoanaerobaculia bacterium]|jgi:hypothetical protein